MNSCSRGEVVLVRYPFSDLVGSKIRPAVVVSTPHVSRDIFIVPLTSKVLNLLPGEFILSQWKDAGLHIPSALKRGLYTICKDLVLKSVGMLSSHDMASLEFSLRTWVWVGISN